MTFNGGTALKRCWQERLAMSEPLFISVIIPTLDRPRYLSRTVADLCAQSYKNAEIIIVDQSVEPEFTRPVAPCSLPVQTLRDSGRGAARARNVGILAAKGDVLLFLDDDVEIPGTDFILQHARAYTDPSVGGVCGRTIELRADIRSKAASRSRPLVYPIICLPSGDASLETQGFVNSVKGGNMSFRADILRAIGGFDERFGFPCIYEETDVALKVCNRGHRILFCPQAALHHIGAPSGGQRMHVSNADRRFVAYRDRVLLFANNCPRWQFPLFLLGNLILAMRPLLQLRGKEASRACAGLFTGIRKYLLSGKSAQSHVEGRVS
jgi:GT2 family glycosyltransferase